MRRREAVGFLGAALTLPFLPRTAQAALDLAETLHASLGDVPFRTLSPPRQALVTNIAEMIIPETDTLGARGVKVPEFIDLILTEWASDDERAAFLAGLDDIDIRATALGQSLFVNLTPTLKTELLAELNGRRQEKSGAGLAFAQLKSLTVYGYFTSRVVDEKILKTQIFFNEYQGDVPFTPAV